MAGVKGRSGGARPNTGGAKPGAGRKTLVTEREVKEQLQKLLPKAQKIIDEGFTGSTIATKLLKVKLDNAWKLINKFAGDRKSVEVRGDPERPLGVVVLPPKHNEDKLDSPPRTPDGGPEKT